LFYFSTLFSEHFPCIFIVQTLNSFTYGYESYTEGINTLGDVEITFTVTDSTNLSSTATITLQPPDNINCHLTTSSCGDFGDCLDRAFICDKTGFPVSIHQDFFQTLCNSISSLSDPSVENWKNEVLGCMYYELTLLSASYVNINPRSLECKLYEDDFMTIIESCITSQSSIYEQFCSLSEDNITLSEEFITMLNSIEYYQTSAVRLFEQLGDICNFPKLQENFYTAGNILCLTFPVDAPLEELTKFGTLIPFGFPGYVNGPCNRFTQQSGQSGRRDISNVVKRQAAVNGSSYQFVPSITLTDGNSTCDIFMGIMSDNITILNCPSCGDGNRSVNEDCDDGNTNSTDGCSSDCITEEGFVCDVPQGELSVCTICGDGKREGIETCDDNNTMDGDGCSISCQLEEDFVCNTSIDPTVCSFCGDGITELYEECDDNNTITNDGCNSTCYVEVGYICDPTLIPTICSFCANGVTELYEECDDNNTVNNDGCNVTCAIEEGYVCDTSLTPTVCSFCANGIRELYEECDDNNTVNNDGCNAACFIQEGYICDTTLVPTICSFCGNGVIELYEQCDDNNTLDNDGCYNCTIDDNYLCDTSATPSLCTRCGDGVREGIEECDDGNSDDMDGCDTNCSLVLQKDYVCMENDSNITVCMERPYPVILEINKIGEVPEVLILFRQQLQFFIDDLDIAVRRSTLNNVS